MSNRQIKKERARVHNLSIELSQSIFPVGSCNCGGTLFLYLKSEDENVFKIRCTKCDDELDVRFPRDDVSYILTPQKQMDLLVEAYGEERVSRLVNEDTVKD